MAKFCSWKKVDERRDEGKVCRLDRIFERAIAQFDCEVIDEDS